LINTLIGKVFGTKNERVVKNLMPRVQAINALEPQMQKLTDAELRAKTDEFRQRIQERLSHVTAGVPADPEAEVKVTILTARSNSRKSNTKRCRKFWMRSWLKLSRWCARLDGVCSTCATLTCS